MIKNNNGFSILMVLALASVVAGVALMIMRSQSHLADVKTKIYSSIDNMELNDEVNYMLRVEKNCTMSLKGHTYRIANILSSGNPNPVPIKVQGLTRGSIDNTGKVVESAIRKRNIKRIENFQYVQNTSAGGGRESSPTNATGAVGTISETIQNLKKTEYGSFDSVKIQNIVFSVMSVTPDSTNPALEEAKIKVTVDGSLRKFAQAKLNSNNTKLIEEIFSQDYFTTVIAESSGAGVRTILRCGTLATAPSGPTPTPSPTPTATPTPTPKTPSDTCEVPDPNSCTSSNFAAADFCTGKGHPGKFILGTSSCPPGPGNCYIIGTSCPIYNHIRCHPTQTEPNC